MCGWLCMHFKSVGVQYYLETLILFAAMAVFSLIHAIGEPHFVD